MLLTRKQFYRIIVLLVVMMVWVPCLVAQADADIQTIRSKAFKLTGEQKFTEALPLLERLSFDLPEDAEVFFQLGFALIGKANVIKDENERKTLRIRARKAFIRAKELRIGEPIVDSLIQGLPEDGSSGPDSSKNSQAEKFLREGEAYFSTGKHDDALRSYEKALKADPKLYEAALFSGDVYLTQGKMDRAEEYYQKAISIDPNRETAYRYSATRLMKQKKFDEARERYVEAYVTEPYNRFAAGGLTQWAQVTGTSLAHPLVEIPGEVSIDSNGVVTVELDADAKLGGKETGSAFWTLYGQARSKWRKGEFAKAYPAEKEYRHTLAEEADGLRAVILAAKADKSIKKLDPSLERLIKLEEHGALESYILLARPNDGIAIDHAAYLKQNREKLKKYVTVFVVGNNERNAASKENTAKSSGDDSGMVEKSFDPARNETSVKVPFAPITCVNGGCIFLNISTTYPGSTAPEKLDRIPFAFVILTKSMAPQKSPGLSLKIDGKAYDLGPAELIGDEEISGFRGLFYGLNLSETEVAALAAAKSVDVKLGNLQFSWPERSLRGITAFYNKAKGK